MEKVKALAKEWDTTETEVVERAIDALPEPRSTDKKETLDPG